MAISPLFKKFRISEYIQYFTDVRNLCKNNSEAAAQVQSLVNAFNVSTSALENTFKVNKASDITSQLTNLDVQRDQAIVCLRKMADAYASHLNNDLAKAGNILLNTIDKYGSRIYTMNYQAETSTLSNLGDELGTSDDLKAVVELLCLEDLVKEMTRINNEFNILYLNRISENTADESISSGEAVKRTVADYRKLIEHLEAYSVISPSDSNSKLIAEINTLAEQYNTTVEQRSSGADN